MNLKKKIASGGTCCGMWLSLPSPSLCEIVAGSGLDFVVVDSEHSPFNPETQLHMLMAFKGSNTVPLIRVPWNDTIMIKQALDMGWDGIVVPQVNTPDEVRAVVSACRYAPVGKRGWGPGRAANYGREIEEYRNSANDSVICVIQIEDVVAADKIDEMIKVSGFDWIFVGPADMSASIARLGETGCAEVQEAIKKIFNSAKAADIPYGNAIAAPDLESIEKQREQGCGIIVLGEDCQIIRTAIDDAVDNYKKVVESS